MSRAEPVALLCLALFAPLAPGQEPAASADRRAAIAAERAQIDKRFTAQEQDCRQRFVVTACLNEARQQRRAALAPMRQEELRIDTAERKQRAAARLGEIEAKQRTDAARDAAVAAPGVRVVPAPQQPSRPAAPILGSPPKTPISAEERASREAGSEARFARQQQDAARHRAAVAARNAERAARGKVAKPLPATSGASAP